MSEAAVPDWAGYLRFRDRFAEAMDPRRYRIEWLDRHILDGTFGLIVGDRAAIIFSIETYPTGAKDIHGQLAAGEVEEIVGALIPQAEEHARSLGCIGAMISSRPGWARALSSSGYETHQLTVRKEFHGHFI
jgi:hypothetical protein